MLRRIWKFEKSTILNCRHQHQLVTNVDVALIGTFPIWIAKIIKRNNNMIEVLVYCKIN